MIGLMKKIETEVTARNNAPLKVTSCSSLQSKNYDISKHKLLSGQ